MIARYERSIAGGIMATEAEVEDLDIAGGDVV